MRWLVFSRNRAYQLDALLRTLQANGGIDPATVTVLHRYDGRHAAQLDLLRDDYREVAWIEEADFRGQVVDWVKAVGDDLATFATDDALVTRPVDLAPVADALRLPQVLAFSLRLGLHLDWCYPRHAPQPPPRGVRRGEVFCWRWSEGEADWGYPLSVDGHVFRVPALLWALEQIAFSNPNTLEANLQPLRPYFGDMLGACFTESRYFNAPLNVVQTVFRNRHGHVDVDAFADLFDLGARFDPARVAGLVNRSAHQEFDLRSVAPRAAADSRRAAH